MKEPQIKLFGRQIILPECGGECSGDSFEESDDGSVDGARGGPEGKQDSGDEDHTAGELSETMAQDDDKISVAVDEESQNNSLSELDDNSKTPSNGDEIMSENSQKAESENSSATNGQQKMLKKPDTILPCPRCNSMDTKFCYYNNYNMNQPRHFCRSCQRYWTAGGTMRNVPVGAGRRKNKNTTSHCHHITISEALHTSSIDASNGFHHMKFKPSDTVLSFNPDSPLCQSMASALCLAEQRVPNGVRNEDCQVNKGSSISCKNGSSAAISSASAEGANNRLTQPVMHKMNGFPSPAPCIPGIPWPFSWNSAAVLPAIYAPGYPLPYCPTPYWNCSLPNGWTAPWLSVPNQTGLNPNSPLGKHSRNGELLNSNNSDRKGPGNPNNAESPIVVPKTLRIDDPEEAAKSSIWETLGIKYDSANREQLFKAFQPKGGEKKHVSSTSPLLQANPAALSRSLSFQERA